MHEHKRGTHSLWIIPDLCQLNKNKIRLKKQASIPRCGHQTHFNFFFKIKTLQFAFFSSLTASRELKQSPVSIKLEALPCFFGRWFLLVLWTPPWCSSAVRHAGGWNWSQCSSTPLDSTAFHMRKYLAIWGKSLKNCFLSSFFVCFLNSVPLSSFLISSFIK